MSNPENATPDDESPENLQDDAAKIRYEKPVLIRYKRVKKILGYAHQPDNE
jgi:hypothetical protein